MIPFWGGKSSPFHFQLTLRIPLYNEARLALAILLVIPFTRSSATVYKNLLLPELRRYEPRIDAFIDEARNSAVKTVSQMKAKLIRQVSNSVYDESPENVARVLQLDESPIEVDAANSPPSSPLPKAVQMHVDTPHPFATKGRHQTEPEASPSRSGRRN
mgnify:CR=1 FL=1